MASTLGGAARFTARLSSKGQQLLILVVPVAAFETYSTEKENKHKLIVGRQIIKKMAKEVIKSGQGCS